MTHLSDTTASQTSDGQARPLPRLVIISLFLMTAMSSYVTIEPAPCDVVFVLFAPLLLVAGWYSLVWPMNPVMYFGAGLFFVMNVVSMIMAYEPSVSARYAMITVYLLFFWLLIISLMAKFGPRAFRVINAGFQIAVVVN